MYVTDFHTTEKRSAKAEGGVERRMTEAAVMIAVAMHFMAEQRRLGEIGAVSMHPDGEHAKQFNIIDCLSGHGFSRLNGIGSTLYGGLYGRGEDRVIVNPKSGLGDVSAVVGGQLMIAECKGGVINSKHGGVLSKTRSGLSELVGQLMVLEDNGARQLAVRPFTVQALTLAERLAPRCRKAGIEIALVEPDGRLVFVGA